MFKIVTFNHGRRHEELIAEALQDLLDNGSNPNLPPIPSRDQAVFPINCQKCGARVWAQAFHHGLCPDCFSLIQMETELSQKTFRMEREVRMRELEKQLAE